MLAQWTGDIVGEMHVSWLPPVRNEMVPEQKVRFLCQV